MRNRDRVFQLIPLIIAASGAALLVVQWAGARPLWLDEEMIAINVRDRSLGNLAGGLSLGQTAPYGWLVLERLALLVFGAGERTLRFVPLSFAIATLVTAVWIGRRWLGPLGATLLVLLCATGRWLTFYFLELKHYSADACFALLLPALAVWAVEERRTLAFWIAAAAAQWFANGALFVMPACAIVMVTLVWRRDGPPAALRAAAPAGLWLLSLAVNYLVVVRPALHNAVLMGAWTFAFPPAGSGPRASLRWLWQQIVPFAIKPGGTGLGLLLWIVAAAGFAIAPGRRRVLGVTFALVTLSAFAFVLMRIVPFYERVSIWIVPAIYVGVSLLADAIALKRKLVAIPAAVLASAVAVDVAVRGVIDVGDRPTTSNRVLDDRSAIRWLSARGAPGDAWLGPHFALPALWWYGGAVRTDRVFELSYRSDKSDCDAAHTRHLLNGSPRLVVYLGFRFDDVPAGFDDLMVDWLSDLGAVVAYRRFAGRGIGLVVDRRQQASHPATLSQLDGRPVDDAVRPAGCVAIAPAVTW